MRKRSSGVEAGLGQSGKQLSEGRLSEASRMSPQRQVGLATIEIPSKWEKSGSQSVYMKSDFISNINIQYVLFRHTKLSCQLDLT